MKNDKKQCHSVDTKPNFHVIMSLAKGRGLGAGKGVGKVKKFLNLKEIAGAISFLSFVKFLVLNF